jgi:hypothetical protein
LASKFPNDASVVRNSSSPQPRDWITPSSKISDFDLQGGSSFMSNVSQIAAATAEAFANPGIVEVLDRICRAEGVNFVDLRSIQILDNEIAVQFLRPNGVVRVSTYPLPALPGVRRNDADLLLNIR